MATPNLTPSGKRCAACSQWKPPDAFNRDKNKPDGRMGACKECRRAKRIAALHREDSTYIPRPNPRRARGRKTCTKCGKRFLLRGFHRNEGARDGRISICKQCRIVKVIASPSPSPSPSCHAEVGKPRRYQGYLRDSRFL